jgi:predicted DNA-binding antitoxin AbrB/MazE fold protein
MVFAVSALMALTARAGATEDEVPLKDLPKAVTDAVKAKYPKAELKEAAKEVKGGKTVYEVETKLAGKGLDLIVGADGKILEIEEEVAVADLPKAVSSAVKAKYESGTIKKAEKLTVTEGNKTSYEVIVDLKGKKSRELAISADGKITSDEEEGED